MDSRMCGSALPRPPFTPLPINAGRRKPLKISLILNKPIFDLIKNIVNTIKQRLIQVSVIRNTQRQKKIIILSKVGRKWGKRWRENWGKGIKEIGAYLNEKRERKHGITCLWPANKNVLKVTLDVICENVKEGSIHNFIASVRLSVFRVRQFIYAHKRIKESHFHIILILKVCM